jgi:hypothetical protein
MYALPTSSITSLFFDTQGDEDTLIIDLSNGNPIPSGGITYAAGSQGNGGDLLGVIGASGKTTFSVAAAQVLVGTRAVNFTSVEQIQIKSGAGDDQLTLAAGIPASTTFSLGAGSNTFNLTGGAYALAADVNAASGALAINVTGATTKLTVNSTEHLSALSISSGARVVLGTASSHAARFRLVTNALSIDATSGLDLAGNDMIVKSGSIAAIEALLARGFNGGDWKGTGLTSSAVANDASFATALGAAAAGDLDIHSFDGESVASADVLVKYTWYGDADLNGAVNGDDESLCLYGLRQGGAPLWAFGDFDYSAHVNGDDYSLFLYGLKNQKAVL